MISQGAPAATYPGWIKLARIRLFWILTAAIAAAGMGWSLVWLPGLALALLALPLFYIALVTTLAAHGLSPQGGDLQSRIHQLIADETGAGGPFLDIGCGSGQLLIRLAKASPGTYTGLDFWGEDWGYSKAQAERNAALEGATGTAFVHGSAARLPFADVAFARVVSCLTFHEVRDAPDKAMCLTEAMRVLEPGGRFVFVDLFDQPGLYPSRQRALETIEAAGGTIANARALGGIFALRFPMTLGKVLKYAVIIVGQKRPGTDASGTRDQATERG